MNLMLKNLLFVCLCAYAIHAMMPKNLGEPLIMNDSNNDRNNYTNPNNVNATGNNPDYLGEDKDLGEPLIEKIKNTANNDPYNYTNSKSLNPDYLGHQESQNNMQKYKKQDLSINQVYATEEKKDKFENNNSTINNKTDDETEDKNDVLTEEEIKTMNDSINLLCQICGYHQFYPIKTKCCQYPMCLICMMDLPKQGLKNCPQCRKTPISEVLPRNIDELEACMDTILDAKVQKDFDEKVSANKDKHHMFTDKLRKEELDKLICKDINDKLIFKDINLIWKKSYQGMNNNNTQYDNPQTITNPPYNQNMPNQNIQRNYSQRNYSQRNQRDAEDDLPPWLPKPLCLCCVGAGMCACCLGWHAGVGTGLYYACGYASDGLTVCTVVNIGAIEVFIDCFLCPLVGPCIKAIMS